MTDYLYDSLEEDEPETKNPTGDDGQFAGDSTRSESEIFGDERGRCRYGDTAEKVSSDVGAQGTVPFHIETPSSAAGQAREENRKPV